jgi:hypothetical protein
VTGDQRWVLGETAVAPARPWMAGGVVGEEGSQTRKRSLAGKKSCGLGLRWGRALAGKKRFT